jgi:hypothetical protein
MSKLKKITLVFEETGVSKGHFNFYMSGDLDGLRKAKSLQELEGVEFWAKAATDLVVYMLQEAGVIRTAQQKGEN